MNREIKFRAWDIRVSRFVGFDSISFDKHGEFEMLHDKYKQSISKYIILLQFTGLRDKNGKEVFEGDVVKAWSQGSCGTFEIKWRQGGSPCWILYPAWQSRQMWYLSATEHKKGKQFISVTGEITPTNKEGFYDDGIEVIGNIYEHPELIRGESKV